jgi:glutamate/tyrosine decarboxylase-like PLP-dependent enzyme
MSIYQTLGRHIDTHLQRIHQAPLDTRLEPGHMRAHLRAYDFYDPRDDSDVFADVARLLWNGMQHASNPLHMGLFRPAADPACIVADALVALYDPNLATYDFAPAAHEIERHTLYAVAERIGFDLSEGAANFTSGGEEANNTAVSVALTHAFPGAGEHGLRALPGQPTMYVSAEAHHSFDKIAHRSGLGRQAVRWIPVQDDLRMDPQALREYVATDRANGCLPFLIVGTAGTTTAGAIDPLSVLADIAAQEGLWFHTDGAWGGAAAVSRTLRPALAGMERADSLTFDAHKWLSMTVGAGMFFCRHAGPVHATFTTRTPYVPPQSSDRPSPFVTTMQWSRRFMGLKLFMTLARHGWQGVVSRIEHQTDMAHHLRRQLERTGWRIFNDTPLPVVCFGRSDVDPVTMAAILLRRQQAWISPVRLGGNQSALRACITHYGTEIDDVDHLVEVLCKEADAR